jgi:predicted transcriptional regulator
LIKKTQIKLKIKEKVDDQMEQEKLTRKILERMTEVLVARKSELVELIKNDVNPENPKTVVDMITKMLAQRGLITPLYACETTFAITQKGMKEINR